MLDPFEFACDPAPGGFALNGETFTVRRPTAAIAQQVRRATSRQLEDILAFMSGVLDSDDYAVFFETVMDLDDGLELDELVEVYEHALVLISGGFPYWVAEQLAVTAAIDWRTMSGDLQRGGLVRPLMLPFDEFLNVVYSYLIRNGDPEGIKKFDAILFKAPAGVAREKIAEQDPKWNKDNMANDFMAQLRARGDGGGQTTATGTVALPVVAVDSEQVPAGR